MKSFLKKTLFTISLGAALGLGALGFNLHPVLAADSATDSLAAVGDTTGLGNEDPRIIIGNIIRYALGFVGIILVCTIVYGGFVWMTSNGNPERVDKAKKILTNAVIGLIIILLSWSIATFVMSALLGATGGSGSGGSGSGGSGYGSGLGGSTTSAFVVTAYSPNGATTIRNIVPRITFSKTVDSATLSGNISITDASGTAVNGTFAASGNTVRFTPSAACPEPNADRFCFDASATYTVTVTANVKSSAGTAVTCSTAYPCSATFTSGTLVDTEDPVASIVVPESGDHVPTGSTTDVQVSATDDAGVAAADFSVDGEWQDSVAADGNPTSTAISSTIDTASFVNGTRYQFAVTVTDLAGNEDTDTVSVSARPEWCFNGVADTDLGETGVDCGGDSSLTTYCGACDGSACQSGDDCSSGLCQSGVCVANPVISDISPNEGAVGTYVTVSGTDFGSAVGSVLFTDAAGTGTVEATVLRDCADGWSDTQIVVEVPQGAGDGPITVVTRDDLSDSTDDDSGALVANFDVNDVVMPNLCSLSSSSGVSESALTLSGSNFGSSRGSSAVLFGSTEAGSYTSWADGTVKVTVPNTDAGEYDVAVTVGDKTSNTIAFSVTVPESDVSTITDISPSSGGIGQYVTISGTNFGTRTGTVTFTAGDGAEATGSIAFPSACSADIWNDDQVTIIVPATFDNGDALVPGAYSVTVTNSDGTVSTATTFTVDSSDPTPGICAITASGDVGSSITISGDHFGTATDTVTFYSSVTSTSATRWTNDAIDVAVPTGAVTGPVTVTVAGVTSNAVNFTVGATESAAAAEVHAAYAWSFSTGEIKAVPEVVSECSADTVSAVPNNSFSSSSDICVNAVVYAEFTTLMNEASVEDAVTVEKCTASVSSSSDDPCATTEAVSGSAVAASSSTATRVTWTPTTDFDVNTTYRVTIATTAVSTDAIALAAPATWEFTTSTSDAACVVDRVTVTPSRETLTVDGQTTGFGANAGTGCVVVDSSDYTWDWSLDSYSYADFNSTADSECVGDPTACATLEALAEGTSTVTATAINAGGAGAVSDDATLTINFTDPYIEQYWPNCTEACTNAEVGASFNTTMTANDITAGDHISLYSCTNELCSSLTLVDTNPSCTYSDAEQTQCDGFVFDAHTLTVGGYYRVIVSGSVTSISGVPLIRTNYGSDYSWTFRVRQDGTLCAVERISLAPETAVATTIGEHGAFRVEAYGEADSCSGSGQRLNGEDYSWSWTDPIEDDAQNTSTDASTAAWYLQSGALLDGSSSAIAEGCTALCTPAGSVPDQAVCGDGHLDQNADGSGEECDDGNTTDHDGCSSTCLYEGSSACSFTCSGSGAACTTDSQCTETCDTSSSTCTLSGTTCTTNSDCPYVASTCGTTGTNCCGNRDIEVDYSSKIAEDCDDGNLVDGDGCSASCTAEGSASVGATCGNGDIAYDATTHAGEECDDGNNASGDGCSRQCLREGSQSLSALGNALCGDGVVTAPYETCDDGGTADDDGCSSTCVREGLSACTSTVTTSCCGNSTVDRSSSGAGEDCDDGNLVDGDGCSSSCTLEGSSVSYSEPSVCGDGVAGVGEYDECESPSATGDGKADATQVAYITDDAAKEVSVDTGLAIANITVTEPTSSLTDTAAWSLSCTAKSDQDCEDPSAYAVGVANCCVPRPTFVGSSPAASATDVCRNAAISATFDSEMDTDSFTYEAQDENEDLTRYSLVYLRLNLASGQTCPTTYTTSDILAMNWIDRTLAVLKQFIFGPNAEAAASTDCVLPVKFSQQETAAGTYKVALDYTEALQANSSYTLVLIGDQDTGDETTAGIASKLGAPMSGTQEISFTTGADICTLDDVSVTDTNSDSANVFTTTEEEHTFTAAAISHTNGTQEITGTSDYDWTWSSWTSQDETVVTANQDAAKTDSATVTAMGNNGKTTVTATATISVDTLGDSKGDTVSGSGAATALLCENPWPTLSKFPWSDDTTGAANGFAWQGMGYFNFSLSYCKDYGTDGVTSDDLPDVNVVLAPESAASDVLKEYLFEVDSASSSAGANSAGDAIGVRILSNSEHLSPSAWYESKGFTGSPSVTTVDGFQAVTDDRSTYIAAANSSPGGLYSNIIVISYNEGASDETIEIYNQMVSNLSFLLNVNDTAVCSDSGNTCSSDFDCNYATGEVCGSDKLKIMRDTKRLADLKDIAIAVDAYGEENRTCSDTTSQTCTADSDCPGDETCEAIVPALSSGTAVRAMASSAWSSWVSTLGGALDDDSIATDPLNAYAACSGYDSSTCVNATTGAYMCPTDSHVYHYRAVGARDYELAMDLEYTATSWVDALDSDSTDNVTFLTSSYCDGDTYGTSSACGDGVIGSSEKCEIGDVYAAVCTTSSSTAGTENQTCNSTCTGYEATSSTTCVAGTCGDGVVDSGEDCDDGSLNGTYGYCGSLCTYSDAEYCGDGVVTGGEACDCGDSTHYSSAAGKPYGGTYGTCAGANGTYSTSEAKTCAWDCRGPASYCGDEVVDSGEECDGNSESWEGALCNGYSTVATFGQPCTSDADCERFSSTSGSAPLCGGSSGTGLDVCPNTTVCVEGDTSKIGHVCSTDSDCGSGGGCSTVPYQTYRTRTCNDATSADACSWNEPVLGLYDVECIALGSCGDGTVDSGEECDDGNDVATDSCTTECKLNVCGDGYLYDGEEQCDEGTGNGGGCSSAYGSTCTACSTTCHYTVTSGAFCGDGVINGDEYCDGSQTPYVWFDTDDGTTPSINGTCDTPGDTYTDSTSHITYTCRAVGMCNGGDNNGELCTASVDSGATFGTSDRAYCRNTIASSGTCVTPTCAADCSSTCPTSETSATLLLTSNQAGADASSSVDLYSYSASSTSNMPNAATISVPSCTVAGNLVADVDFSNVDRPDVYVVFVTDESSSMNNIISGTKSRLDVAKESLNAAVGTLFDELGSKAHIGLVNFQSTSTVGTKDSDGNPIFIDDSMEDAESTLLLEIASYGSSGGTHTNEGIQDAMALFDANPDSNDSNAVKIIVLLSDGQPNAGYEPDSDIVDALKAGVEIYSIALSTDSDMISDMNTWSSNTICSSGAGSITECTNSDPNAENNIDYSYSGSTEDQVSGAYDAIIDSIMDGTASVTSSSDSGTVVVDSGSVRNAHSITLPWPSNFSCNSTGETEVPIQITFRGEGTVNISNVKINYCAP